ncbi:UNVERIFIED_CONTAM: hypothetical protein GTU68_007654, partial [Idotea baltica]|nr:hypothetical protein [Idotea baltica]
SPLTVTVLPQVDVTRVKVDGLEPSVFVDSPTDFVVDTRALGSHDGKVLCLINNPSGSRTDAFLQPLTDGSYKISYTPFEEGRHTIELLYDGVPVPGSPFTVNVRRDCDPKRCRAYGPGLEKGIIGNPNIFTVETKGAGTGGLGLAIVGPSESKVTCQDNRDGSCTVEYVPLVAGEYDVAVKFGDQHIPGSPFKVIADSEVESKAVQVWGPGVEPSQVRANKLLQFHVDGSEAGSAPLDVNIKTDKGPLRKAPEILDKGNGVYDVTYVAPSEGTKQTTKDHVGGDDVLAARSRRWFVPRWSRRECR